MEKWIKKKKKVQFLIALLTGALHGADASAGSSQGAVQGAESLIKSMRSQVVLIQKIKQLYREKRRGINPEGLLCLLLPVL